ncbi:MAG: DUF2971 domain-containing protein [Planctomycetes bacterium]|nr:DUF2971 domain-containing protein [Planctomycetota bacterium]
MTIPMHLYKYRSLSTKKDKEDQKTIREYTSRILTHNEIYFAKPSEFNDPFDCGFHISCEGDFQTHKNKLKELNPTSSEKEIDDVARKQLEPDFIKKTEQELNDTIRLETEKCGIFTMSAKRDNLLMWPHYADYHQGICLEFKTTDGKLFGCDLLEVHYQRPYPNLSLYDKLDLDWVRKYLSTKSEDWLYEEEWRITYIKTGLQLYPPEELSGVILGACISNEDRELVLKWISERNCKPKLYRAKPFKDRFGLDIKPL